MVQTSTTQRSRLVVTAALAVLAGLLLWTAPPAEAAPPQLPLDHFRCYRVIAAQPPAAGALVLLQDQFAIPGALEEAFVRDPTWFCNPAEKRHKNRFFEITNPDGHLKFYRIDTREPEPQRVVKYRNQFGGGKAVLGDAIMLAVPTQKEGHPPPDPASLDHFKCYQVLQARPANALVGLADQWRTEPEVEVGGPVFFCNPTRKVHPTGQAFGINNPNAHLMCYRTSQSPGVITTVLTFNQFGDEFLIVDNADVLCVPTRKSKKWKTLG